MINLLFMTILLFGHRLQTLLELHICQIQSAPRIYIYASDAITLTIIVVNAMDRVSAALVVVTGFCVVPGLCVVLDWDVTTLLLIGFLEFDVTIELSVVIATVVCGLTVGLEPRDVFWGVVIPVGLGGVPAATTIVEHRQAAKNNLINADIFLE